jgi:hypothetical protein
MVHGVIEWLSFQVTTKFMVVKCRIGEELVDRGRLCIGEGVGRRKRVP